MGFKVKPSNEAIENIKAYYLASRYRQLISFLNVDT